MNENRLKTLIGLMRKEGLLTTLKDLQEKGYIKSCKSNFRCGYNGYLDEQFFASFYFEFQNGEAWIVYSTNSIRSDRMTFQQWHAEHIKKICGNVKRAFVVVPDVIVENEKECSIAENYDRRIQNKEFYSPVDRILKQTEFIMITVDYADSIR